MIRVVAGLSVLLFLSACQLTPTFTTGYQIPGALATRPLDRRVAVIPFEEQRPPRVYTKAGRMFLTYVPLLPWVSFPFERLDESVRKQSDRSLY